MLVVPIIIVSARLYASFNIAKLVLRIYHFAGFLVDSSHSQDNLFFLALKVIIIVLLIGQPVLDGSFCSIFIKYSP